LNQFFQKGQSFQALSLVKESYCLSPLGLASSVCACLCANAGRRMKAQEQYERKASPITLSHEVWPVMELRIPISAIAAEIFHFREYGDYGNVYWGSVTGLPLRG
jgi:hypothetical protein